ncbi:Type IV pilus biogenesis and competence protein PilQ precursor [Maioricimonas rarisocia]|uniref:Type IV pilus biogenesis and competence protein PilQ n=2 Tax=Maioricimonas rarisocia TaxID=2528026 RepID=A0A517Z9Y3_9PLAN|nr:Type IV pilus biogenesis and competence protein PilQ precursor [Maioricimonas rarisocia]
MPAADRMPGFESVLTDDPMPVVSVSSVPDIPVVTAESSRSRSRPRFEELPPPPLFVANQVTPEPEPSDSSGNFETLQTQIELLRSDLERMTTTRVDNQLEDLRRVQTVLEQLHGTEQIHEVEKELNELRTTYRELKTELEEVTAEKTRQQQTDAGSTELDVPLSIAAAGDQTGLVTVQAKNVPVADVLRSLARHAGRNVVCAADIGQPVTVHFDAIDPSTAIRMIAATQNLQLRDQEGLWHIDNPPAAPKIIEEPEPQVPPRTQRLFRLRHLDPLAAARLIHPLLSGTGQISHQAESDGHRDSTRRTGLENALLVVDEVDRIAAVESLIAELDHPPQMVEIQATIFEVVTDSQDQACVLTLLAEEGPQVCFDPDQCAAGGCTCDATGVIEQTARGLITEVRCRTPRQIEHALSRFGHVRTVAMPHVQVADRARAELVVGEQVLLQAAGGHATRTSAALPGGVFLAVRPVLSDDGLIRLEVHPRLGAGHVTAAGHPAPTRGGLETTVVMSEGCSLVIGGIVDERVESSEGPHPVWTRLPFVGRRVHSERNRNVRRELLITITPRIVVPGEQSIRPIPSPLPRLSEAPRLPEEPVSEPEVPVLELTGATRGGAKRP